MLARTLAVSGAMVGMLTATSGFVAAAADASARAHQVPHASQAAREPGGVVARSGKVGPLRLDRTKPARVIRLYGPPDKRKTFDNSAARGTVLSYRCGRTCTTDFVFNAATGRLTDFSTESRRYRTQRGTRPGMTESEAERRERSYFVDSCTHAMGLGRRVSVEGDGRRVKSLWSQSPRHHAIIC